MHWVQVKIKYFFRRSIFSAIVRRHGGQAANAQFPPANFAGISWVFAAVASRIFPSQAARAIFAGRRRRVQLGWNHLIGFFFSSFIGYWICVSLTLSFTLFFCLSSAVPEGVESVFCLSFSLSVSHRP